LELGKSNSINPTKKKQRSSIELLFFVLYFGVSDFISELNGNLK